MTFMSWFTRKELIECAACKGTGKQKTLRAKIEMEGTAAALKDWLMLLQGICLSCRGAGKVRR